MKSGPLAPITFEALKAIDRVAKILKKAPRDEWEFILLQAKEKADKN
ncbi:MAG: hypothetical protein HYV51_02780 [Parcubacteria group bacterium]|nr:hypothetical protein [Parcubacteria group bacterium]